MRSIARVALSLALTAACRREPTAHRAPCRCHDAAPAAAPLPDTSAYTLEVPWTDQDGRAFHLASLAGSPTVVLMFYGTCQSACPILLRDAQRVEAALTPAARARTRFVLVTFDPSADTAERLRALAAERRMDLARWSLLRGADGDVRAFATVLGVQYSRLGPREFTHSNVLTLLDAQGVAAAQLEGLAQPVDDFARRVEALAR